MIPLDRVRAMLAAATPGPWRREREDGTIGSSVVADAHDDQVADATGQAPMRDIERRPVHEVQRANAALIAAAPDLARDVLTLADALATAERERDRLTACLARANATIEETERARYAAEEERDTARSAHAADVAAARAEALREAEDACRDVGDDYDPRCRERVGAHACAAAVAALAAAEGTR